MRTAFGLWKLAIVVVIGVQVQAWAAGPKQNPSAQSGETVEMFQAMADGRIEVKLIPKDATQATVLIKNKTDKPLSVKLPDVFAGVPVLAQLDGGIGRRSSDDDDDSNQAFGGGFGGGGGGWGGGGGGFGGGGGMWNVPPEKVAQIKVPIVCLEHGKPNPRAAVPYVILPVEKFTTTPGVREVLQALGSGMVSQRVAQVAAWHLNNGMSFQELACKQLRFANGTRRPYFSPGEIRAAFQLVAKAKEIAEKRSQTPSHSPGDGSLSRN